MRLKNLFRVNSPLFQDVTMGFILFCLPGIYIAITGLGAGGGKPDSSTVANQTNAILYAVFTFCAWLSGTVVNVLKPKLSIMIGSLGYPLYIAGLWYFDRTGHKWFPLWAGAMLGMLCGILQTVGAYISFAYPEEKDKGLFISIQYSVKATGAFVGALIAFCVNVHQSKATGVSNAVYIVFIVIQMCSLPIALIFIKHPKRIVRDDGRHIAIFKAPTLSNELRSLMKAFFDKRLLCLFPAMFVCEMPLAMISTINAHYFDLRTRSLNNLFYQFVGILAPYLLIHILDNPNISSRRRRGIIGTAIMGIITLGACVGLYIWLKVVNYAHLTETPAVDWTGADFAGMFVIYMLFGLIYSGYQVVVEWTLSALTNDPSTLAQFAGMIKGTSALGICISFIMAAQKVPTVGQLSLQFGLYVLGYIGHFYVIAYHVPDTNYFAEENVIAPVHVEDSFIQKGLSDEQRAMEHAKEREAALMGAGEILEGVMALEAAPAQQNDVKHGMESAQTGK
ncbi:hypothetical protein LTR47_009572 [Exophiala xenobiotica]|nr:hypothetical protein LTR41_010898 [Exophiala xenobiotica]KAK5216680.1 hypothetical protein LTR72_010348 [Exophiala xenobiotica]KAK5225147.1 hypothetical protein LTR47_009572 [Exophiala xenobiotica]KAK5246449.1 hypothetical protein LTS06_008250 [Exophiala xenobiotica]KAK5282811.1 hypothetical protein LTR40_002735 [Exophiala xenobiotica]